MGCSAFSVRSATRSEESDFAEISVFSAVFLAFAACSLFCFVSLFAPGISLLFLSFVSCASLTLSATLSATLFRTGSAFSGLCSAGLSTFCSCSRSAAFSGLFSSGFGAGCTGFCSGGSGFCAPFSGFLPAFSGLGSPCTFSASAFGAFSVPASAGIPAAAFPTVGIPAAAFPAAESRSLT